MSYWTQKIKSSYYAQRRRKNISSPPSAHRQFRSEWEQGLEKALIESARLRNEGWDLDFRSPLTKKQADKIAKEKAKAYEFMQLPVAKWMDEEIVYLFYKRKPGVEETEQEPEPSKQPKHQLSYEDKFRREIKDVMEWDGGATITDKGYIIGYIKPGMLDVSRLQGVVSKVLNEGKTVTIQIDNFARKIIRKNRRNWLGIKIGETYISPANLLKVGRIVGSKPITVYTKENEALVIPLPDNSFIAVAPVINPGFAIDWDKIREKAEELRRNPNAPY
ncbi:MAG: hypothetical protein QXU81_00175 [Candidatus Bathyarchaeia archaeon]